MIPLGHDGFEHLALANMTTYPDTSETKDQQAGY